MSEIVIRAENISKHYQLGKIGYGTLKHDVHAWWAKVRKKEDPNSIIDNPKKHKDLNEDFWALREISFEVKQGESVGIIGKNGAGKSTLLKILSRTTAPTNGNIFINGKIASLLEVGTGFHPDLTGRENIYLNGAILGMKKREIDKKFDEIVDFSGIAKFIDTPVKRYSSGMFVRLAFAVAAHLESDILILDEVLAVGDAEFQKKCLGKMDDVTTKQGRTVLFVSHNLQAVNSLCNTSLFLENGRITYQGSTRGAIIKYLGDVSDEYEKMIWINKQENKQAFSNIVKIFKYYVVDENGDIQGKKLYNSKEYKIIIETEIFKKENNLAFFISYYTETDTIFDTLIFVSDIHDDGECNRDRLTPGKKIISLRVPTELLTNKFYKLELSCVIHCKGWVMLPGNKQRLKFEFVRDSIKNSMGYDLINHPFTGSKKPGIFNPIIKWDVKDK